jgi:hypothetical protein
MVPEVVRRTWAPAGNRSRFAAAAGRGRSLHDWMAFATILVFLAVHPFHHLIYTQVVFYREIFAVAFGLLAVRFLAPSRVRFLRAPVMAGIGAWFVFIVAAYIVDPGIPIYGGEYTLASQQLGRFSPSAYVLRTSLLYLPLVVLLTLRGLNLAELRKLLWVLVAAAPISIVSNYATEGMTGLQTALAFSVGTGLSYNSYVPYVTFPLIGALYLSARSPGRGGRLAAIVIATFLMLFFVVNPSRQSVMFALLAVVTFGVTASGKRALGIVFASVVAGWIAIDVSGLGTLITARFFSASALETARWAIMREGLALMGSPIDWLVGHGLSSVVVSGPHNNYIRVTQRIGLFGMALTYFPFVYALVRIWMRRTRDPATGEHDRYLAWLLGLAVFFTIFHSFFGYPQDDAWQAPYVWVGLGMVLAVRTETLRSRSPVGGGV